jgi:REP element-mobilizing transposase RayT
VWHVGARVNWRRWHLESEAAFRAFVECLASALKRFGVDLLAFALMSNHYHAVLRCPASAEYHRLTGRRTACRHYRPYPPWHPKSTVVGQCLRYFQLAVARRMQGILGLEGHFWDGNHFRRRVRDPQKLVIFIAYDHRNPLRQGMVDRVEDYPRSSAAFWLRGDPSSLPLCRRGDLPFGLSFEDLRSGIIRYQEDKRVDDVMEAMEKAGLPLDSDEAAEELERQMERAGLEPPRFGRRSAMGL